jgi:hypothetical protein
VESWAAFNLPTVLCSGPRESIEARGLRLSPDACKCMEGSISFFCLLAGRISSRSTGTPNETRKRRLMRERSQLGGARGGGAISCVYRERLRSDRKICDDGLAWFAVDWGGYDENRECRYGSQADCISERDSRSEKSGTGLHMVSGMHHTEQESCSLEMDR